MQRALTNIGLLIGLTVALPYATYGQVAQRPQPSTTTSSTSSQPPEGAATGTTDRQGQTNQPGNVNSPDRPTGTLPATGSTLPLIGIGALIAIALGFAVRFGVDSIE
jgi:hypothetical protein